MHLPTDPVGELEAALTREVGQAVERIGPNGARPDGIDVELERPKNTAFGDYATTIAIELARRPEFRTAAQMRSPREVAEFLAGELEEARLVDRVEVAGPGFLNVWVPDEWLVAAVDRIIEPGPAFGANSAPAAERIQVEMVSANPTGPITVDSARNGAYGDSVARLLELAGHRVESEYYYNDAGAQMEKFKVSVEARRRGEDPPEDGYRGAYVDELAATPGDPVPRMLEQIEHTLDRFRVHFDSWAKQSELEGHLGEFLPRLDRYEKDGAVWARSSEYGDDDDRVLIRSREQ